MFDQEVMELANLSKALAHPARISILKLLTQYEDRTCKELVAELPLSQSTVSQHLKELVDGGLISRKANGAQSLYYLEGKSVKRFVELFAGIAEENIRTKLDR